MRLALYIYITFCLLLMCTYVAFFLLPVVRTWALNIYTSTLYFTRCQLCTLKLYTFILPFTHYQLCALGPYIVCLALYIYNAFYLLPIMHTQALYICICIDIAYALPYTSTIYIAFCSLPVVCTRVLHIYIDIALAPPYTSTTYIAFCSLLIMHIRALHICIYINIACALPYTFTIYITFCSLPIVCTRVFTYLYWHCVHPALYTYYLHHLLLIANCTHPNPT